MKWKSQEQQHRGHYGEEALLEEQGEVEATATISHLGAKLIVATRMNVLHLFKMTVVHTAGSGCLK